MKKQRSVDMKRMLCLVFLGLFFIGASAQPDNYTLLMTLKESAMEVIAQHQDLINRNKDGTYAKKKVTKEWISMNTYQSYLSESKGKSWELSKLKGSYDKEQLAVALSVFLASARNIIAKVQPIINTDSDGTINPKNFYPAVFGRLTADEFFKRTGIKIKQTTTGKGLGPRNKKYNLPDAWEKQALAKLTSAHEVGQYGFGEEVQTGGKTVYRYIYPLVIKKACLSCHGEPRGEKDISGYPKEGYKLGEIRGGISIVIP
jgi:hypothetical protein